MAARVRIDDFELANRIYAGATVSVKDADDAALLPIYSAMAGAAQLPNPQRLDNEGKFNQACYVESAFYCTVSGLSVGTHDTGVSPQPETFSLQNVTSPVLNTITALKALAGVALTGAAFVLGFAAAGDLGGGLYWWNAADARADDGGAIIRPASAPATGRWNYKFEDRIPAGIYGVKGDRTTDDLAAFNAAKTGAYALRTTLFAQPLPPGYYYKLSGPIVLQNMTSFVFEGAGTPSLFVMANGTGLNCFTLDGTSHATIRGIGIYGTSGSGHGIEFINASSNNKLSHIWGAWMDGDFIKFTSGQSNTVTECDADENNGYRPATLVGGLTDGQIDIAFHNPSHASGQTNNNTCVQCRINAAGATYGLKVGTSGGSLVESFTWLGGLIQGVNEPVYLHTKKGLIQGAHIEPPVGALTTYIITMDAAANTIVADCEAQGDVRLLNACDQSGFERIIGCGYDISASSELCFVRYCQYGNIVTGPAGGRIIDRSGKANLRYNKNAANERFHVGDSNPDNSPMVFETDMSSWLGGAVPTVPAGLGKVGAGTLTRSTAVLFAGSTYTAKHVSTLDFAQYLSLSISPALLAIGKYVTVEVELQNEGIAGAGVVTLVEGGTGSSVTQSSAFANTPERIIVSFKPNSAATGVNIRFSQIASTVYWGRIRIWIHGFVMAKERVLEGIATPEVTAGGRQIPNQIRDDAVNVTNFPDAIPGEPFTVFSRAAFSIVHGGATGPIITKSGANIVMADGSVARFSRAADTGYVYEV